MKSLLWIEQNQHILHALESVIASAQDRFEEPVQTRFVGTFADAEDALNEAPVQYIVVDPTLLAQASESLLETFKSSTLIFYTHLNANEFMPLARRYNSTHVLLKELPFDSYKLVDQLKRCLFSHAYRSVWGLEQAQSETHILKNSDDMFNVMSRIEGLLENVLSLDARMELCTPLMEAITNAVYHAPKRSRSSQEDKYRKGEHIDALDSHEAVEVSIHVTDALVAVAIKDFQGTLSIDDILNSICKNFTQEALYDENGRGFFLMYCLMDELQITLEPERSCEIILLKSRLDDAPENVSNDAIFSIEDEGSIRNKPLIINVLNPEVLLA
ncbi:MAG: ATP-binding protein [Vampirovibrionales bacterium]|jgi:anti-sigma regulatory factor (Ser/Thr protein kinase)